MTAIINTKIILEDGYIFDGAVVFDKEKIIACGKREEVVIPSGAEIIDAQGLYTAPGLIDIHNHGSDTYLFTEEPEKCAEYFIKHGETTVLPTLYCTLTKEQMLSGAEKIKKFSKTSKLGKMYGGLYMEGPYMGGFGSNQKAILWNGDIEEKEFADLVETLGSDVKVWAIAPERKGIEVFMEYVRNKDKNVIFSLGHSHATAKECRALERFGIKLQTHHQDSGKAPKVNQVTIGAGCDEYTLYTPEMYAEIICDETGVHVPEFLLKSSIRAKGVERIVLITDSMPKLGDFKNNEKEGVLYGSDLNYDSEGHLAGSHLTLENACRNVMAHTGYGLCHAIRFATVNPAKLLGIYNEVGSIAVGKKPNIILIDDTVRIKKVFLGGEQVV